MTQQLEIEFKNMLTKTEYDRLLVIFHISGQQIFPQENHYFDTTDFSLKQKSSALRIRKKEDHYEMTLKQPASVGLLETTQKLSEDEAMHAIQTGTLPSGMIESLLEEQGIPFSNLEYFGSLMTNRAEVEYQGGLLVLDHSIYLNKEDFELELEVEDYDTGKVVFLDFLQTFNIPMRETENKIRRFYRQKHSE